MKRSVKTMVLLIVLAVLIGSYFGVKYLTQTEDVVEEMGNFALIDLNQDDLIGLTWINGDDTLHFVKKEDAWANADDASFPTNQDAVQALADDLFELEADRKLENIESIADYGLDNPSFTVTSEWSDGTTIEYAMGDETPFGDGYYLKLSGNDMVVYTISSSLASMFSTDLVDLAELETLPTVERATRLIVGDTLDITWRETSTTLDDQQNWYDTATGKPLDDDSVETLINVATSIDWSDLLTASADEEDLASWNLSDDAATVVTIYDGNKSAFELLVGTTNDYGDYYARLPKSAMVYIVSSDSLTPLLEADAVDLQITDLIPMNFEFLAEGVFTIADQIYTYQRTETNVIVEKSDESEATENTGTKEIKDTESSDETGTTIEVSVTLNGEETDPEAAETLWKLVSALKITAQTNDVPEGITLLTITATNRSNITASFDFFEYDANSYLVTCSDGSNVLTAADSIDELIRNLKQIK